MATIWQNGHVQSVQTLLISRGHAADLTGWTLTQATAISPDASAIVGIGIHNGAFEGWRVILPHAPADDGVVFVKSHRQRLAVEHLLPDGIFD